MKLTKRERILIYILVFLIINLVGIQYIYNPLHNRTEKARDNYYEISDEYELNKFYYDHYDDIIDDYHISNEKWKEYYDALFYSSDFAVINEYLNDYLIDYASNISNMNFSHIEENDMLFTDPILPNYQEILVECTLEVSKENLMRLIDTLQINQYLIKIEGFEYDDSSSSAILSIRMFVSYE